MNSDINQEVHKAFEIIKEGGIILYPTDTVWGIGCDATNPEAVAKIYRLKQREESKSMIVLMNGEKMIYNVFKEVPEVAWHIIDLSEKPTTIILDEPRNVAANLIASDKTLGIRLAKEPFCFKLMEKMKKPLSDSITVLKNLFMMPDEITYYEESTVRLNDLLSNANSLISQGLSVDQNAFNAIKNAKNETENVCQRIIVFSKSQWIPFAEKLKKETIQIIPKENKY
jgi:tRNA threonylcarbamoyl adenosine modification protein (Sua5/YciO/YrdC/YwlC family)